MVKFFGALVALCLVVGTVTYSAASYPVKKVAVESAEVENAEVAQTEDVWYQEVYNKVINGGGKSQVTALILVCLVGGIGIHRFYLGYTGIGIIQLLTAGGCGIWSLIDLIRIITGDLKPKRGRYSKRL